MFFVSDNTHLAQCTNYFSFVQVTPTDHRYFQSKVVREEGGTPAIVGAIRAGLAMRLKQVRCMSQ